MSLKDNFFIRNSKKNDCGIILSFINKIAEYEKLASDVIATEESIATYLFSDKPMAECLLAFENEKPVGFALFFHNYSSFVSKPGIYLEDLFVDVDYRGKGYGKALLTQVIETAKIRNCGRVEWSVLDWNKSAIDFYKNMGAKAMDEWTVFRLSLA